MNFLAHIYLSGEDEMVKLGNFMADSIKGKKYLKYPLNVQHGIILHRSIDYYTDTHPVFKKSAERLFKNYGHYNGIIVDILYDHFLAANWHEYHNVPLKRYTIQFYEFLKMNFEILPKKAQIFVPYMIRDNWLLSYASIDGIAKVLDGMNRRTGNLSGMDKATAEFEQFYDDFEKEFRLFFEDVKIFSHHRLLEIQEESKKKLS